jgi:hypothetical protein
LLIGLFIDFEKQKKRSIIISLSGFLAVIALSFIPTMFLSSVANNRSIGYVLNSGNRLLTTIPAWLRLWNLEYLFDKGDLFAYRASTKEIGVFLSIFIIPYIAGLFYFIKNFSRKNFPLLFVGLFALVAGLPSALTSNTPYSTRVVPMLIPLCIIIALGIEQIDLFLSKYRKTQIIISFIFGVVLIYQISLFTYIYFVHFRSTSQPEFMQASVKVSQYLKTEMTKKPDQPIYFLTDKTCGPWSFDTLFLWYFADLPNQPMIKWNNAYRQVRYNSSVGPFNAYSNPKFTIPTGKIKNIILFPGYKTNTGPGINVRCGSFLPTISTKNEKIDKIFYAYDDINRDPFYVVSENR